METTAVPTQSMATPDHVQTGRTEAHCDFRFFALYIYTYLLTERTSAARDAVTTKRGNGIGQQTL